MTPGMDGNSSKMTTNLSEEGGRKLGEGTTA